MRHCSQEAQELCQSGNERRFPVMRGVMFFLVGSFRTESLETSDLYFNSSTGSRVL